MVLPVILISYATAALASLYRSRKLVKLGRILWISTTELYMCVRTLALVGAMQIMSDAQHKVARSNFFALGMVPVPPFDSSWAWHDMNYDTNRRRHLSLTNDIQSDRITLDLTYMLTGFLLAILLIWIVRGTIHLVRENILCCEGKNNLVRKCDDLLLFPGPELVLFVLILPGLVKNTVAPFSQSGTSENDIIASLVCLCSENFFSYLSLERKKNEPT